MDGADSQPVILERVRHSRRGRRYRKLAFYRKCRIPIRAARIDPSARNPMRADLDAYLEYWRLMGFREAGVLIRRKALRRFVAWADARGLRSTDELTPPLLERYRRDLFLYRKADGLPLAMNSQQLLLVPLKGFFKWLARSGRIRSDPAAELELPRKPARLPVRVLSVAEVERTIDETDTTAPWGVRDRAILEVLYSTGMRRAELAALGVHDWDRDRGTLAIRQGKGGRDRVVPIGKRASFWLARYLETVRPVLVRAPDDATLFLTDYGEPFGKNRLGDLVRRHLDWAGIRIPGACHLLRHACATHMLENGADIRFIQALLGHADLRSTQIYTHVSIGKLKEVHAATHPADRLSREEAVKVLEQRTADGRWP
ncbi:MAG: site-specific tyrosine recombinase XerC [Gemmatimonadaceae bacterium]